MLVEYAMMPDVFDPAYIEFEPGYGRELQGVLRQLGSLGMVANLDKDEWHRTVAQRIRMVGDQRLRSDIERCLSRLHDLQRLPNHPKRKSGHPENRAHWLELIRQSHKAAPFDGVVDGPEHKPVRIGEDRKTCSILDLRSEAAWVERRTYAIRMCESEMRMLLEPVMRHAKCVELVDPYLTPGSPNTRRFLRLIFGLAGRRNPRSNAVSMLINTTAGKVGDSRHCLQQWQYLVTSLRSELGVAHRIRVAIWKHDFGEDDLHDRYLFTEQCGISIGRGWDCYAESTARKSTLMLLDSEVANERRIDFNPNLHEKQILASQMFD